jgi:hypothetical protein
VEAQIATSAVEDVMQEEAASLSGPPNPHRRESRRYAESIRNFARVAVDRAFAPLKALWKLRAGAREVVGGLNHFAKWVVAHSSPLVSLFPEGSTMQQIIRFIVEAAKRWG